MEILGNFERDFLGKGKRFFLGIFFGGRVSEDIYPPLALPALVAPPRPMLAQQNPGLRFARVCVALGYSREPVR